jgi:SAM-dependent methyltransferase
VTPGPHPQASPGKRFSWEETQRYWEVHQRARASVDFSEDRDALGSVCHSGAPLWLNRYYARFQRKVYESLLARIPPVGGGEATALEIGCGGGRWVRLLASRGYRVTGIDLQADLIERNRREIPGATFLKVPLQDLASDDRFDLVSSVTVLQHNPFDEQVRMAEKIRSVMKPAGHLLILENIRDQGAHVFSNSVERWTALFQERGFRLVATRYYDFSPFSRSLSWMTARLRALPGFPAAAPGAASPDSYLVPSAAPVRGARAVHRAVLRVLVAADGLAEPLLLAANRPWAPVHSGFLFRAA